MAGETPFRDSLAARSPRWLRNNTLEKVLYAIAIQLDALGDATVAGVKARFPGLYTDESLSLIGRDRRIRRGRNETAPVYASRLLRWLDDHRQRGMPYALLAQLHAHYADAPFQIDLMYRSQRRFVMDAAGVVTRADLGDVDAPDWPRWTLYYFASLGATSDGIWGDPGTWTDGGVWDSTLTPDEVTDLRLIPREWNAAHCYGTIVLFDGTVELWDYPAGLWSDSGDWGAIDDIPVQLSVDG